MPKFLEKKLKKEYPNNPSAVYGTMNKLGYMEGSKETEKGRKADIEHQKEAIEKNVKRAKGSNREKPGK